MQHLSTGEKTTQFHREYYLKKGSGGLRKKDCAKVKNNQTMQNSFKISRPNSCPLMFPALPFEKTNWLN